MVEAKFPHKPLFQGMITDLNARIPLYLSDFENTLNLKILASIFFMFFTSIGPAITFASLLQSQTDDQVGAVEVMLSSAITGMLFAAIGGQPLVILGVTGPVSILTISLYNISKDWGLKFIPFYGWSQIWACIMHMILAIINFNDLIMWISRFSGEIFGCLIAIIYIYTGLRGIGEGFGARDEFEVGMFQLVIALGTAWLGLQLSGARSWKILNEHWRDLIADYGATISLIFWSGTPYMGRQARDVDVDTLDVPKVFETTSGRRWYADLHDIPVWGVFAAILPGFIITVLFFFDHNVSSLMCQAPEFRLKKPSAYHWDFFVVGLCMLMTGFLGIPPTNGLIPQAPLHTKSVTVVSVTYDSEGRRREQIENVYEQRVTNFCQAFLIGLMAFQPFLEVIRLIPNAALDGLFLFLGFASFGGNQLAERVSLIFTEPQLRSCEHGFYKIVTFTELKWFTSIQAVICVAIFCITLTPAAVIFPVLIGVLIPFRRFLLPMYFREEALEAFDPLEGVVNPKDEGTEEDGAARRTGSEGKLIEGRPQSSRRASNFEIASVYFDSGDLENGEGGDLNGESVNKHSTGLAEGEASDDVEALEESARLMEVEDREAESSENGHISKEHMGGGGKGGGGVVDAEVDADKEGTVRPGPSTPSRDGTNKGEAGDEQDERKYND